MALFIDSDAFTRALLNGLRHQRWAGAAGQRPWSMPATTPAVASC